MKPRQRRPGIALIGALCVGFTSLAAGAREQRVSGDADIRKAAGASEIRITTTSRLAGAIHSLNWNGKEFIDSFDHGRQLQSACSFNLGRTGFHAECFNPTEAGSRSDGRGASSTSRLIRLSTVKQVLQTTTRMAFWLRPGQKSSGKPALNRTRLSGHRVSKRVRIGYKRLPQVIDYLVTFTVPKGEHHTYAQFEALTGYMPPEFKTFLTYRPETGRLVSLGDGPGEQQYPVVLSTQDAKYAMGIYSPQQPAKGYEHAGYGRFRFPAQKVVKWNCVFRVRNAQGIKPGDYRYQMFVAVGTREDVRQSLLALHKMFPPARPQR